MKEDIGIFMRSFYAELRQRLCKDRDTSIGMWACNLPKPIQELLQPCQARFALKSFNDGPSRVVFVIEYGINPAVIARSEHFDDLELACDEIRSIVAINDVSITSKGFELRLTYDPSFKRWTREVYCA